MALRAKKFLIIIIALILVFPLAAVRPAIASPVVSPDGWEWQNPTPQGNRIWDAVTDIGSYEYALPSTNALSLSIEDVPSTAGHFLLPGSDVVDLAVSGDGETIWACVGTGAGVLRSPIPFTVKSCRES